MRLGVVAGVGLLILLSGGLVMIVVSIFGGIILVLCGIVLIWTGLSARGRT